MGVSYNNTIMYGKEFESFTEAMEHLQYLGKISEEECKDFIESGEYYLEYRSISFQVYSCYTGGAGILGEEISAKTLYTDPEYTKKVTEEVDAFVGTGCEIHEFVQIS